MSAQDEFYDVEAILDMRQSPTSAKMEFFVKWKGYLVHESSWVSESDLGTGCAEMMAKAVTAKRKKEALDADCLPKFTEVEPKEIYCSREKEVDSVLGAVKDGDKIMLYVKWRNDDTKELVSSVELRKSNPQKLIEFYQSKLKFA